MQPCFVGSGITSICNHPTQSIDVYSSCSILDIIPQRLSWHIIFSHIKLISGHEVKSCLTRSWLGKRLCGEVRGDVTKCVDRNVLMRWPGIWSIPKKPCPLTTCIVPIGSNCNLPLQTRLNQRSRESAVILIEYEINTNKHQGTKAAVSCCR